MKPVTSLAVLLFASILAGAAPTTRDAAEPPKVGDKARGLDLETLDGKPVRLSELSKAGPVILIELRGWVGYQCPLCTRQVGDFIGHTEVLRQAGATVVLIYPGPAEKLKEHAEDFLKGTPLPENFRLATDPDLKFVAKWGLRWDKSGETAYPATFVVDSEEIVRFAKVSHSHGDRATAKEVLAVLPKKS